MEFRRVEITRRVRVEEKVNDDARAREIFAALNEKSLTFSMRTSTIGIKQTGCRVLAVQDDKVEVWSAPGKVKFWVKWADVDSVEVESNVDFTAGEGEAASRWDNIMGNGPTNPV